MSTTIIHQRLLDSWRFYRSEPMTPAQFEAATMLTEVSGRGGFTHWLVFMKQRPTGHKESTS